MRLVILQASTRTRWLACLMLGFVACLGAESSAFTIPADRAETLRNEWRIFKQRYWTAMSACSQARVTYCEPYYEWLEARGQKHSDELFAEYQKDHGPCPADITPGWIPQFEERLMESRDPAVAADMTNNLLIIYGNQRMTKRWLALYLDFCESNPQSPIVGTLAESALYNAKELGQDDMVASFLTGASRHASGSRSALDADGKPRTSSNAGAIRLALAKRLERHGDQEGAIAAYQQIVEDHRGTWEAKEAEGAIYESGRLGVGKSAPDFVVRDLSGEEISLSAWRGRVVFIEFWDTHCGPCKGEIPTLKELHAKFGSAGLQMLGVSLDTDGSTLKQFLKKSKMNWPQTCDFKEFQGDLARAYHVRYIPRSILIDREGRIVQKDLRGEALIKAVADLVTEKKAGPAQLAEVGLWLP
jgi:peroxiredoxin